ncbi:dual specificity protein phosphatase 14 [Lampris incognitus]|uniref:dual specificity protein phosphatase 14 n=1 Tax=Lampris incognitus TaxID=2546036 RepID=UPI0024B612A0|nr:dual specificity protein phosphatase 14 [Lampris incognitus]
MSVSQVAPGLFLSGLDAALNRSLVASRDVTLIVNASGLEVAYPHPDSVKVLQVPVQDQPHAPIDRYFDSVAKRISENRTGSSLVHCVAGRSRSPALVLAYLMKCEGVSLRQAHELVMEKRSFIRPNAGFWRQLMAYERSLFGRNSMRMTNTCCGLLLEAVDADDTPAYCVNI